MPATKASGAESAMVVVWMMKLAFVSESGRARPVPFPVSTTPVARRSQGLLHLKGRGATDFLTIPLL